MIQQTLMQSPVSTVKILYDVARRVGLDPDVNLSPDQAEEILGFMDDRCREGWEMYDFLDITETEERAFRDDYNTEVCYKAGDYVWDPCSRMYYQAVTKAWAGRCRMRIFGLLYNGFSLLHCLGPGQ